MTGITEPPAPGGGPTERHASIHPDGASAASATLDLEATRQLVGDLRDDLSANDGPELLVGREWATELVAAVLGHDAAPDEDAATETVSDSETRSTSLASTDERSTTA